MQFGKYIYAHTHAYKHGKDVGEAKKRIKPSKNCRRDSGTFIPHASSSLQTGGSTAGTRQLRSQGLVPVHAHRTEGLTGSVGREGANGVGGGIGGGAGSAEGRERRWERCRGRERGKRWCGDGNGGGGQRKSARWDLGRKRG